jgi:hypothetical protein
MFWMGCSITRAALSSRKTTLIPAASRITSLLFVVCWAFALRPESVI